MFKKVFLIALSLVMVLGVGAQSRSSKKQLKGAHPYDLAENKNGISQEWSHWSIAFGGGFNSFDGDWQKSMQMKHPVWAPSVNFDVQFNFTPNWFIGGGYVFDWYRITGASSAMPILLDGYAHRTEAYLGFDLMSLCFPKWKQRVFGWELFVGGGLMWYQNHVWYGDDKTIHTAEHAIDKYKFAPYYMWGTALNFNTSRATALGLKLTYAYSTRDDLDGHGMGNYASKNNDGMFDVSMYLRIKFVAKKKTNLRNINSYEAYAVAPKAARGAAKDTLVIVHKDTVYMVSNTAVTAEMKEENRYFVYFENDKSDFDEKALITIQQVNSRLLEDSTLYAVIVGHCDNTGTIDHNDNLGFARAQNVFDELVLEHRFPAERLTYSGEGIIVGGRSQGSYSPYRRCDIRLVSKAEFDPIAKLNNERDAVIKANASEAMKERVDGVITAPEGMTLSAIARKYYGNTYCWVYIYEANRNTLKSPNYIPAGTRLVLPDLTEEQYRLNKRQAEVYYQQLIAK